MSRIAKLLLILLFSVSLLFMSGCGSGSSKSSSSQSSTSNLTSAETGNTGIVAGRVLTAQGIPVSGATVSYSAERARMAGRQINMGKTDNDGYYSFQAPSGSGRLNVASPNGDMLYENVSARILEGATTLVNFPEGQRGIFKFAQVNSNFDGTITVNSNWGEVAVTLPASTALQFVNISVNGDWAVKNVPIEAQSSGMSGRDITINFNYLLGVSDGVDVTSAKCALDISGSELTSSPSNESSVFVGDASIVIQTCDLLQSRDTRLLNIIRDDSYPLSASHDIEGFPNQQSRPKECVYTAVSNSLRFLNKKYDLNMPEDVISIEGAKTAVGYNPTPYARNWWDSKKAYMEDHNYPIGTLQIYQWNDIYKAIQLGMDVEIAFTWPGENGRGHMVDVVSITIKEDGSVSLKIADDGDQENDEKGLEIDDMEWDPATGLFANGKYKGAKASMFLLEWAIK